MVLGDAYNVVGSTPVDNGHTGDWDDDGDVDDSDKDIISALHPVATDYHPFPVDDIDDDNVRTGAKPDIGNQELIP